MITIDTHQWNWAQWTMIVWLLLGLLNSGVMHGKPMLDAEKKPMNFSFPGRVAKDIVFLVVLVVGGFFGSHA